MIHWSLLTGVLMPTILRSGPYRVFFYSSDGGELRRIRGIILANRLKLLEAWNEFFDRAG